MFISGLEWQSYLSISLKRLVSCGLTCVTEGTSKCTGDIVRGGFFECNKCPRVSLFSAQTALWWPSSGASAIAKNTSANEKTSLDILYEPFHNSGAMKGTEDCMWVLRNSAYDNGSFLNENSSQANFVNPTLASFNLSFWIWILLGHMSQCRTFSVCRYWRPNARSLYHLSLVSSFIR